MCLKSVPMQTIASAVFYKKGLCSTCVHFREYRRLKPYYNNSGPSGECKMMHSYVYSTRLSPCYGLHYEKLNNNDDD